MSLTDMYKSMIEEGDSYLRYFEYDMSRNKSLLNAVNNHPYIKRNYKKDLRGLMYFLKKLIPHLKYNVDNDYSVLKKPEQVLDFLVESDIAAGTAFMQEIDDDEHLIIVQNMKHGFSGYQAGNSKIYYGSYRECMIKARQLTKDYILSEGIDTVRGYKDFVDDFLFEDYMREFYLDNYPEMSDSEISSVMYRLKNKYGSYGDAIIGEAGEDVYLDYLNSSLSSRYVKLDALVDHVISIDGFGHILNNFNGVAYKFGKDLYYFIKSI